MRKLLFVLSFGALLLPSAAQAQDEWVRQVRSLLVEAGKVYEDRGYSLTHSIATGSLDEGRTTVHEFQLDIGRDYQIIGACDNDCDDVDLTLFDSAGRQLDEDILEDDFPIVSVSPSRSGTFQVRVSMASCGAEPCRYGIGIFGK